MHSTAAQLSNHIKRTVAGPMWHGPSLDELLGSVSSDQAAARPVTGAHSIWEIVLHVTAWAEIALARLHGQRTGDPAPEEDWPPVSGSDPKFGSDPGPKSGSAPGSDAAANWQAALERLRESYRALATDTRRLETSAFDEKVAGADYSVSNLLHGVIEHGTYHGGQIALLKRALEKEGQP
jgi:uncharacterized damage-inducible protein DinB